MWRPHVRHSHLHDRHRKWSLWRCGCHPTRLWGWQWHPEGQCQSQGNQPLEGYWGGRRNTHPPQRCRHQSPQLWSLVKKSNCKSLQDVTFGTKQLIEILFLWEPVVSKSTSGAAEDLSYLSLSLNDMFFENMSWIIVVTVAFTFEGLSWFKQQSSLSELIIRTCVCCTVLCAIIHLGEIGTQRDGKWGKRRGRERKRTVKDETEVSRSDMKRADKHKGRGRAEEERDRGGQRRNRGEAFRELGTEGERKQEKLLH